MTFFASSFFIQKTPLDPLIHALKPFRYGFEFTQITHSKLSLRNLRICSWLV
jgi:hypothetical protein